MSRWRTRVTVDLGHEPTKTDLDRMAGAFGAVTIDGATVTVGFETRARTVRRAIQIALSEVAPWGEAVGVDAQLWEQADFPRIPALVGVSEIAGILGVTRQRASQITGASPRPALPGFPEPVAHLATGPVYVRSMVEAFAEQWRRKPGRAPHP